MGGDVLNIAPAVIWLGVLSNLLAFGISIWALLSAPSKKNASRIDTMGTVQTDHDKRIGALEQAQGAMPTKDDMHSISMALEGVKGEMKALSVEMRGNAAIMERLEAIVSRHESHLLKS
jgi:Protein of unknown function (DUF2730)